MCWLKRNMATTLLVLIVGASVHAAGNSGGVIDLGKAEIRGKQALPQVNFILRTSPVEFDEQEPRLDDVLDGIDRDVLTAD